MPADRAPRGPLVAFDDLFHRSPDGILILDASPGDAGLIIDANPRAGEMLHHAPEDLRGQNLSKFLASGRDWPKSMAKAALNHGITWEDRLETPGEAATQIEATASGFRGPSGSFVLMTLHKVAQPATPLASPMAEFTVDLKGFDQSVLNIIAHEFRTPLTPLLIQVLKLERNLGPFLGDTELDAFRVIHRNIARIEASVHAIMAEAAARAAERQPVDEKRS